MEAGHRVLSPPDPGVLAEQGGSPSADTWLVPALLAPQKCLLEFCSFCALRQLLGPGQQVMLKVSFWALHQMLSEASWN